jgi:hypothetical protein
LEEYAYRQAFPGVTHEAFLDEPRAAVRWLMAIHGVVQEHEAQQQKAASA